MNMCMPIGTINEHKNWHWKPDWFDYVLRMLAMVGNMHASVRPIWEFSTAANVPSHSQRKCQSSPHQPHSVGNSSKFTKSLLMARNTLVC